MLRSQAQTCDRSCLPSFCHSYRQDGGLYDEARSQKETEAGENIYRFTEIVERIKNHRWKNELLHHTYTHSATCFPLCSQPKPPPKPAEVR